MNYENEIKKLEIRKKVLEKEKQQKETYEKLTDSVKELNKEVNPSIFKRMFNR